MSSPSNNLPEPKPPQISQPKANQQANPPGRVLKATRYERHFIGPLPDPAALKEFDVVLPGCAERIVHMAEEQASHRQLLEKTVIIGDSRRANHGLYIGGAIVFLFLVGSVFLIYNGHDWAGVALGTVDLVALAGVFVYGTISRRAERTKKAELMNSVKQQPDID